MKIFAFFILLSVCLCLVSGDIKIRRRRQLEKEEERHEEVVIKDGRNNETVEVDVEEDDDGRDVLKFFLDDLPFRRPLYPMMSDFGLDLASLLVRMQQMAEMANAFQSRMNDLPVISNETDTENIEINGRKFIKTVNTVVKGDKDMKISLHTITLKPADANEEEKPDPNEYEVASSNDKKTDSDAKKPETEVEETTPKSEKKPEKDQLERETRRRRKRWAMCTKQNCESHANSKMLPLLEMRQNQGDADSAADDVTPPSDILPWEEDPFPSPSPTTSPPPSSSSPSPPTTPAPLITSPPKQPTIPVAPITPQPVPPQTSSPMNPAPPFIPMPGPIFPLPQQPSYQNQDSIFNLRPVEGPKFDPYWPPFPPRFYPSFVPQRYRLLV